MRNDSQLCKVDKKYKTYKIYNVFRLWKHWTIIFPLFITEIGSYCIEKMTLKNSVLSHLLNKW